MVKKNKQGKDETKLEQEPACKQEASQQATNNINNAQAQQDALDSITLTKEEMDQVKNHIAALQQEQKQTVELAQRLQADFDNYRRRNASVRAESYEEGLRDCIKQLLPILDNFDRALQKTEGIGEDWLVGITLVHRQLLEALGKMGLEEVPSDGQFDPNLHEAVMQEPCAGKESGSIIEVLQKGYQVKNRIIRHSMVKVAQ